MDEAVEEQEHKHAWIPSLPFIPASGVMPEHCECGEVGYRFR